MRRERVDACIESRARPTIELSLCGQIGPTELRGLCAQAGRSLADGRAARLVCDVRSAPPDATTLEAIARLALVARRRGAELKLRGASRELRDLLEFAGLASVLAAD